MEKADKSDSDQHLYLLRKLMRYHPKLNNRTLQKLYFRHMKKAKIGDPKLATMVFMGSGFIITITSFIRRNYAFAKEMFDIAFAVLGFFVLSPLWILIALIVKLTSQGSILYIQTRVGKNGKHFTIYKFRTMKADAEKETGPVWATQGDSRFTPPGKFLRTSHIDELPQLINVIKGEMSIIGPRPERPTFVDKFIEMIPDYEKRSTVKPGITGLAQVWCRADATIEDVKKKLKYDLLYIKKMCLLADFNIIFRTFRIIITAQNPC